MTRMKYSKNFAITDPPRISEIISLNNKIVTIPTTTFRTWLHTYLVCVEKCREVYERLTSGSAVKAERNKAAEREETVK